MKAKSLTALDNDHYFTLVVNLPIKEMDIFDFFFFILTYEYTLQFGQIKQKFLKKNNAWSFVMLKNWLELKEKNDHLFESD